MIRVPRLKTNRHGIYCLRVLWLDESGKRREVQHSLGTKSPTIARLLALQFNLKIEHQRMTHRKPSSDIQAILDEIARPFELDLSKGIMKADGPDDHARMMEALKTYKEIHGVYPPLQEAMNMGRPTLPPQRSTKTAFNPLKKVL